MATEVIRLAGCTSTPLASYLKALGVLRLISSPSNNATGIAADAAARGWWEGGTFHLATNLDPADLIRFLLNSYAPSVIIAPWNGGSGFYPKDNKEGFGPLTETVAPRFRAIAAGIAEAAAEIGHRGLTERPKDDVKAALITALRGRLPDSALQWLDAAVALSGARLSFPQLLGTGGNDGRLDFTNNFMRRLVAPRGGLFDAGSGSPSPASDRLLRAALDADVTPGLRSNSAGQFAPGDAGGANASVGYEGNPHANPWDFVLALEGAALFAGAATRRHQGSPDAGASFPFTVRPTAGGSGGVAETDVTSVRAEFWAPLWHRPAGCDELIGLLKEGRAILHGKTARDGLDFARAATSLGTSRGMTAFERYGFVMRQGNMYLAAPLGRRVATSHVPESAELINDLDTGGWLQQVRRAALDGNAPGRVRQLMKRFQDVLFALTDARASAVTVQSALELLGEIIGWLATNPHARSAIPPPPRLRRAWVQRGDDGSPEYRAAAALASLGWDPGTGPNATPRPDTARHDAQAMPDRGTAVQAEPAAIALQAAAPMAVHLAPVALRTVLRRFREWDAGGNQALMVWGAGGLVANLVAVLGQRSLVGQSGEPLLAAAPTHADVITQFLAEEFDDVRCSQLLGGLVWALPTTLPPAATGQHLPLPPFAYTALKLLFAPGHVLDTLSDRRNDGMTRIPLPPGLLGRLRVGDVDGATALALNRARSSGIASPFAGAGFGRTTGFGVGLDGRRLAAALLIPIYDNQLRALLDIAYPTEKENEDAA